MMRKDSGFKPPVSGGHTHNNQDYTIHRADVRVEKPALANLLEQHDRLLASMLGSLDYRPLTATTLTHATVQLDTESHGITCNCTYCGRVPYILDFDGSVAPAACLAANDYEHNRKLYTFVVNPATPNAEELPLAIEVANDRPGLSHETVVKILAQLQAEHDGRAQLPTELDSGQSIQQ